MDLSNLKLFRMASRRMDWLSKRQVVLAQNIANSDTPNYRPQDLKKLTFKDLMRKNFQQQGLEKTSLLHIKSSMSTGQYRNDLVDDPYESAPGGNAVILEEQLTKITETQSNHRLAANVYNKQIAMLKIAIGRPGR